MKDKETLDTLPSEILTQIFFQLPSLTAVVNLASTCHHMRNIYKSSRRLPILFQVAAREFGPLDDIMQLCTHNASQPAHIKRSVNISGALLTQVVHVGRIAQRWTTIYPIHKWKDHYEDRRLLTDEESYRFRRALYRLWLFDRAFHNSSFSRYSRLWPAYMQERALLLLNYNAEELAEMLDVHLIIRVLVSSELCPSDRLMRSCLQDRASGLGALGSTSIHLNYALGGFGSDLKQHFLSHYANVPPLATELGWGDDIRHYYVVEDMMKLDPEQILQLYGWRHLRYQVKAHVSRLGEWFDNNGEVFSETLGHILKRRGGDLEELKETIFDEDAGIVIRTV